MKHIALFCLLAGLAAYSTACTDKSQIPQPGPLIFESWLIQDENLNALATLSIEHTSPSDVWTIDVIPHVPLEAIVLELQLPTCFYPLTPTGIERYKHGLRPLSWKTRWSQESSTCTPWATLAYQLATAHTGAKGRLLMIIKEYSTPSQQGEKVLYLHRN